MKVVQSCANLIPKPKSMERLFQTAKEDIITKVHFLILTDYWLNMLQIAEALEISKNVGMGKLLTRCVPRFLSQNNKLNSKTTTQQCFYMIYTIFYTSAHQGLSNSELHQGECSKHSEVCDIGRKGIVPVFWYCRWA